jgi:hypothetical protein
MAAIYANQPYYYPYYPSPPLYTHQMPPAPATPTLVPQHPHLASSSSPMPPTPSSSRAVNLPAGITQEMYEQTRERLRRYLAGEEGTFSANCPPRPPTTSPSPRLSQEKPPTRRPRSARPLVASNSTSSLASASSACFPASSSHPSLDDIASRQYTTRPPTIRSDSSFAHPQSIKKEKTEQHYLFENVFYSAPKTSPVKTSPIKARRMTFDIVPSTPAQSSNLPTSGRGAKGIMERVLDGPRSSSMPAADSSVKGGIVVVDDDDDESSEGGENGAAPTGIGLPVCFALHRLTKSTSTDCDRVL